MHIRLKFDEYILKLRIYYTSITYAIIRQQKQCRVSTMSGSETDPDLIGCWEQLLILRTYAAVLIVVQPIICSSTSLIIQNLRGLLNFAIDFRCCLVLSIVMDYYAMVILVILINKVLLLWLSDASRLGVLNVVFDDIRHLWKHFFNTVVVLSRAFLYHSISI